MYDCTSNGRTIHLLAVIEAYTRECLAIEAARRLKSDDVLEQLNWLMATRGVPGHIRSDKSPEMMAKAVRNLLSVSG